MPLRVAAQRFAQSSGRLRDRSEGPRGGGLYEELFAVGETCLYRAPRVNAAPRSILINKANGHVAQAMPEPSDGEREPAECILTKCLRCLAASTPHQELDLCIHGDCLLCVSRLTGNNRTARTPAPASASNSLICQ
jgi:hypothetical protein